MSEQQIKTMPILALRGMTVLPGMLVHLDISREITKRAIEEAMAADSSIFISVQKDMAIESPTFCDLHDVGVIAKVRQEVKLKDDIVRVMLSTEKRGHLLTLTQTKPFLMGDVMPYEVFEDGSDFIGSIESKAMCQNLKELYNTYLNENPRAGRSAHDKIKRTNNLEKLVDLVAMHISMTYEKRQELLECLDLEKRYEIVAELIMEEINLFRIRENYRVKVKEEVDKQQKEYYLREQMKVIRQELGEGEFEEYHEEYFLRLGKMPCSEEVEEKIAKEINRLGTIPKSSSEYAVASDYIETLLSLPWEEMSEDCNDIAHAEEILEEDHYGLKKVKERILEFLAVRTLTDKGESPIICLVGPPGTGKTSIAKSIARALEKEYVRICLGGVRDEAEIRGHRRTYVGALPGRFIDGLKKAKVKNPLMLLDEIDKVSSDYKGDTASALLEVLDPEQNRNFVDHYVELPIDLSEVLFICTANSLDTIPRPLLDRMEVIRIEGYTENEKFHIGKQYLIEKQLKKNGLMKQQLGINDTALRYIIRYYTRESGVRELERQIGAICRKTAKKILAGEEKVRVSGKNLEDFLGKRKYRINEAAKKDDVGIVRGLAWTQVGGSTLEIEVNTMAGEGKLKLTGKLGEVMKESAQIALSYVRSLLPEERKFFKEHDFHLHVPEGAVPKDGPSAGVTMATALYSAVTGKKVKCDVAMTGEITLRGRVLAIGGLKEKMLAAKAVGVKTVLIPKENEPDYLELEEEVTEGLTIICVETVKDVLKHAIQ